MLELKGWEPLPERRQDKRRLEGIRVILLVLLQEGAAILASLLLAAVWKWLETLPPPPHPLWLKAAHVWPLAATIVCALLLLMLALYPRVTFADEYAPRMYNSSLDWLRSESPPDDEPLRCFLVHYRRTFSSPPGEALSWVTEMFHVLGLMAVMGTAFEFILWSPTMSLTRLFVVLLAGSVAVLISGGLLLGWLYMPYLLSSLSIGYLWLSKPLLVLAFACVCAPLLIQMADAIRRPFHGLLVLTRSRILLITTRKGWHLLVPFLLKRSRRLEQKVLSHSWHVDLEISTAKVFEWQVRYQGSLAECTVASYDQRRRFSMNARDFSLLRTKALDGFSTVHQTGELSPPGYWQGFRREGNWRIWLVLATVTASIWLACQSMLILKLSMAMNPTSSLQKELERIEFVRQIAPDVVSFQHDHAYTLFRMGEWESAAEMVATIRCPRGVSDFEMIDHLKAWIRRSIEDEDNQARGRDQAWQNVVQWHLDRALERRTRGGSHLLHIRRAGVLLKRQGYIQLAERCRQMGDKRTPEWRQDVTEVIQEFSRTIPR